MVRNLSKRWLCFTFTHNGDRCVLKCIAVEKIAAARLLARIQSMGLAFAPQGWYFHKYFPYK